jgi:hypothetical protein
MSEGEYECRFEKKDAPEISRVHSESMCTSRPTPTPTHEEKNAKERSHMQATPPVNEPKGTPSHDRHMVSLLCAQTTNAPQLSHRSMETSSL